MAQPLYVAELIIYIFLIQPTLYCLWKHGKRGILGWLYLQFFCAIRVVASAVTIHEEDTHASQSASLILSSVGLSPLLLSAAGILHEARSYRNPRLTRTLEWLLVIQYHFLVSTSLAMIVVAVVYMEDGHITSTTSILLKTGAAMTLFAWISLCSWSWLSLKSSKTDVRSPAFAEGTKLLRGVIAVLILVGVRLIYAVISLVLEINRSSSDFPTSLVAKVCMSVVPEMIVVIILNVVGLNTRKISKAYARIATAEDEPLKQGYVMTRPWNHNDA